MHLCKRVAGSWDNGGFDSTPQSTFRNQRPLFLFLNSLHSDLKRVCAFVFICTVYLEFYCTSVGICIQSYYSFFKISSRLWDTFCLRAAKSGTAGGGRGLSSCSGKLQQESWQIVQICDLRVMRFSNHHASWWSTSGCASSVENLNSYARQAMSVMAEVSTLLKKAVLKSKTIALLYVFICDIWLKSLEQLF